MYIERLEKTPKDFEEMVLGVNKMARLVIKSKINILHSK